MTVPSVVRAYPASGTLGVNSQTTTQTIDTTGLGANGAVLVGWSFTDRTGGNVSGATVSACTLDGVNLTSIKPWVINAGSVTGGAALYGILAPASNATASLVITMSGAGASPALTINVVCLQNVDSFGNNASYNDGSGTTSNQAISVTGSTNALCVAIGYHGDTITGVGGSTTIAGVANNYSNVSAAGCGIAGTRTGVGGSTTLDFTSSLTDHWTIHAVEVVGTGSAPVVPISILPAGTGNSATSTTTLAFNCGNNFAVGDVILVFISADNNGASGATSLTSVTDAKSHVYTLLQATYDPGAAAAGQTIGIAYTKVTTAMVTTDQITINFSPATVAKAAVVWQLVPGVGYAVDVPAVNSGFGAGSGTGTPTITTASVTNGDLVVAGLAVETNAAVTADADTTNGTWSAQATATGNSGTVATSSRIASQGKIVTATATQTYNPTLTSADCIDGWIIFHPDVLFTPVELPGNNRARMRAASW